MSVEAGGSTWIGTQIRERRVALRLTRADVVARSAGAMTDKTLKSIEDGEPKERSVVKMRGLMTALDWPPGGYEDYLLKGELPPATIPAGDDSGIGAKLDEILALLRAREPEQPSVRGPGRPSR